MKLANGSAQLFYFFSSLLYLLRMFEFVIVYGLRRPRPTSFLWLRCHPLYFYIYNEVFFHHFDMYCPSLWLPNLRSLTVLSVGRGGILQ